MNQTMRRVDWRHLTGLAFLLTAAALVKSTGAVGTGPATTGPADAEKDRAQGAGAQPATPASLQEAARVIDLRTFPTLPHEELFHKTVAKVGYKLADPDLQKSVEFYRGKLTDAGWKTETEDVNAEKQYGIASFSKQGFILGLNIVKNPNDGKMMVFLENQGNIDARSLPRFGAAEVTQPRPDVFIYVTDGKIDAVTEFVRTEFNKLGSREVVGKDGETGSEKGVRHYLRFIYHGMEIDAHVHQEEAKVEVWYQVRMLKVEMPIMPDAKGVEHMEEPFLHLFYATPSKPEAVLEFYRKELPALGWSIQAGTEKGEGGAIKVALETPDKAPARLEILAKDGPTFVLIAGAPAAR